MKGDKWREPNPTDALWKTCTGFSAQRRGGARRGISNSVLNIYLRRDETSERWGTREREQKRGRMGQIKLFLHFPAPPPCTAALHPSFVILQLFRSLVAAADGIKCCSIFIFPLTFYCEWNLRSLISIYSVDVSRKLFGQHSQIFLHFSKLFLIF